ncbi:transcriptional regulator [Kineosporia sp. NBRC 101677]|uniref:XRE family transcriptional regulator n=1 Tax=Kineosporia sp. NBRC 101677 TaxID=3032197 RepID=UPI00249FF18F|nr:XRE family transcriptional regulator [Kineosporia sp. NBRC 101677]GLY18006.1 transcriptional regulator [Kineosporia sp. NBRC 101677]
MAHDAKSRDALRRAVSDARLREIDIAVQLQADPKTVSRWLQGRMPQARFRVQLAELLGANELDLWPQLAGASESAPELQGTYDYRSVVPHEVWSNLFGSAEQEIGVLVYSGLFLAEDIELMRILVERARAGVKVRLLLGDPDCTNVARRGVEEGIANAMSAKIRNALVLYRPLRELESVETRLHRTVLYNSLYWADDEMLVNQHVYGLAAAHAPVLHLRRGGQSELFGTYLDSFERVWDSAAVLNGAKA